MCLVKVRLAGNNDTTRIIQFIYNYWRKEHIFVRNAELFEWQYKNPDGRWNIVLAEKNYNDGSSILLGILGFIPFGRYDPNLGDECVFLAVWKVREDICPPGVGLHMLKYINKKISPSFIGAIGITDVVKPIYKALGYHTGKLDHLALFNPFFCGDYKVAKVSENIDLCKPPVKTDIYFIEINLNSENFAKNAKHILQESSPIKSIEYLKNRYHYHPWYNYHIKGVMHEGILISIIVLRTIDINDRSVIRVVDIIGDRCWLKLSGHSFLCELKKFNAEYLDIMAYGISITDLNYAGFHSANHINNLVIPNYFEPFVQSNIDVFFAYKDFSAHKNNLAFFRADSDQDRPN